MKRGQRHGGGNEWLSILIFCALTHIIVDVIWDVGCGMCDIVNGSSLAGGEIFKVSIVLTYLHRFLEVVSK